MRMVYSGHEHAGRLSVPDLRDSAIAAYAVLLLQTACSNRGWIQNPDEAEASGVIAKSCL